LLLPVSREEAEVERDAIVHRWEQQDRFEPVFVDSAGESRFSDHEGTRYLDAFSQSWYAVAGHGQQSIVDAISEQAQHLASVHAQWFSTQPRRTLARRLLEWVPAGFRRIFFGANGSDATEVALKLARFGTGRQAVVAFSGSYHGAGMAATSVTGMPECREGFGEPVPGTVFVPYPYCYRCPLRLEYPSCNLACADLVEDAIETQGKGRVAAVIGEVVKSVSGVVVPPPPYWRRIREIADRHGAWLIFDEVVTGFGRTGSRFAMDQFDVVPDVLAVGKALTSGYLPLSAALFSERASATFESRPLYHGMSFEGHAVCCAAALANLDLLEGGLLERGAELGTVFESELARLKERHPCVGDVRGVGVMWGIELVRDRSTKDRLPEGGLFVDVEGAEIDAGEWSRQELLRTHRIHVGVAPHMIQLAPPLGFGQTDLGELVAALDTVLSRIDAYCEPVSG
jgi:taurine---2-oxoglutarate transaminase